MPDSLRSECRLSPWSALRGAARRGQLRRANGGGCAAALLVLCLVAPAHAVDVKLWPLIDYHHDASGHSLRLLGPLFSYTADGQVSELILRPLFSFTRDTHLARRQLTVLYPLFVSRWDPGEADYRLLGLIAFQRNNVPEPDAWERRFTIFPFVFYRYSRSSGSWLSVLPFYANVRDFFGYERIQMVAFPLYLHLQEPLVERSWLPFPFVSWTGGTVGRGVRVFPFYGSDEEGETERSTYVLWPFYVSDDLHFTRPEAEHRRILYPFYSSIDSPTRRSRSYLFPFFLPLLTHSVDRKERTDTWGFPWPAWVSQRNLDTGQRTAFRLAPFYEDTHFGNVHSHFILWPLYRWRTQEVESYRHSRNDIMLVVCQNSEDVQSDSNHRRYLHTLLPIYRASGVDGDDEFATPALLDAVLPHNLMVQRLYAPLWQIYTRQRQDGRAARWSLLWNLISSDGTRVRYPLYLDGSE